jgi:hypothetical protein
MTAKLIVLGIVLGAGLWAVTGNAGLGIGLGLAIAAVSVVAKPKRP